MPAVISSGLISVCSLGATVPWPPVTNILMISAPCLISSRTARRKPSAPSERLMAPRAPTSQYQGKLLSPACPVVLTSRLPAIRRGPGKRPSAMAAFIDASMAKGAPALTAPVKPLRSSNSRWCAARTACSAGGSSRPKGAGLDPSSL